MTVEQHDTVDFVGFSPTGELILTISDHLPWDKVNEHLFCLQEKLNCYLRFVESGELFTLYPNVVGRQISIDVVLQYPAPEDARWFFDKASQAISAAGFRFSSRHLPTRPN